MHGIALMPTRALRLIRVVICLPWMFTQTAQLYTLLLLLLLLLLLSVHLYNALSLQIPNALNTYYRYMLLTICEKLLSKSTFIKKRSRCVAE